MPPHWEAVWDGIAEMRKLVQAPVDTMGCESLAELQTESPKLFRFQCLVGLMLSAQTRDEVTAAAMKRLRAKGLSIDFVLATAESELASVLYPVCFYKNKARHLRAAALQLREDHADDVPDDMASLLKLPGVGPKMAHLFLQVAYGRTDGIGVDVHVHRLCNRLGWVQQTKLPEDTRRELEDWLPRDRWRPINKLLVGFGQTICRPVRPLCGECTVSAHCPSAFRDTSGTRKRKKSTQQKERE